MTVESIKQAIKIHKSCKQKNCGDNHKGSIAFYKEILKSFPQDERKKRTEEL